MAAIGISEFTFGFAFLYEQTHSNWPGLRAAPILPSLQQEQDAGWDARLPLNGIDFYYQFKLSDYLSRRNAAFIADGTYQGPYYRVAFHRKDNNRQHQRLREHAHTNPHTYYVAPEFDTLDDFNAAFLARQITARSRMIPLTDCDDVFDGNQHYITFQTGHAEWIQHSESKQHARSFLGRNLDDLYGGTAGEWVRIDKPFADNLFQRTATVVRRVLERETQSMERLALPLLDFDPHQAERRDVLLRTSEILSVVLGVTLVLVGALE